MQTNFISFWDLEKRDFELIMEGRRQQLEQQLDTFGAIHTAIEATFNGQNNGVHMNEESLRKVDQKLFGIHNTIPFMQARLNSSKEKSDQLLAEVAQQQAAEQALLQRINNANWC